MPALAAIGCRARSSRGDYGVVEAPAGEAKAGSHVFLFKVRQFFDYLLDGQARCQQIEHIGYPDAQAAHAWTPAALSRISGDSFGKCGHGTPLTGYTRVDQPIEPDQLKLQAVAPEARDVQQVPSRRSV